MASTVDFVEYVKEQIADAGDITYRKMFGEFGVYCDGKIIGLVCDNQFFVKKTKAGEELLNFVEEGKPYPNARPHFLIDSLSDREFLANFIRASYEELPMQKTKKKKIVAK